MRGVDFDLGGVDVGDLTTTVQERCTLAIDTPTPEVVRDLSGHDQPNHEGICSCKQSKNKQEQDEQAT
jgi:hypothetical protein